MTEHLYLAVTCKTPGNTAACLIKYVGTYSGQIETEASTRKVITDLTPERFEFLCSACKQKHRCGRHEVYPVRTEKAPEPSFQDVPPSPY
jgi:hypothetical protein